VLRERLEHLRLARDIRFHTYPFSVHWRSVLDRAGVGRKEIRGQADLRRLPVIDLGELPREQWPELVLRPGLATIVREGPRLTAARAVVASLTGGRHRFGRNVDHRYKPVHWVLASGVPVGYSSADLARLADLGSGLLVRLGIERDDVLVNLDPGGASLTYWQLVLGARRLGTAALHAGSLEPAEVAALRPSALAGSPDGLRRLRPGAGELRRAVRTVVVTGELPDAKDRLELAELFPGAVLTMAWAPAGVRALWGECRASIEAGESTGLHTWPGTEVIEVWSEGTPARGELLWTGVGWRGTAFLRLRTHTVATIEDRPCPACGRAGVRLRDVVPAPEAVLSAEPAIRRWRVERRAASTRPQLIVFLELADGAEAGPLLRRLDRRVGATQYVVES